MAPRLQNWDQLPAGKFSSGGEVSAVAPHHLRAKRSHLTSSPSTEMGLMHRWSQSSLPLKAVLAKCSVVPRARGPGPMHSNDTAMTPAMTRVGFGVQEQSPFCAWGPTVPHSQLGYGSLATSTCCHADLLSHCPLTTVTSCSSPPQQLFPTTAPQLTPPTGSVVRGSH